MKIIVIMPDIGASAADGITLFCLIIGAIAWVVDCANRPLLGKEAEGWVWIERRA